ncbi:MAG: hypothetical protein BWY52_02250 [Chloroflexi bacterium ADurb.Bin325]|nr:MAG: hypothetical protein BWY52_02250 [Chloroflexi bacterium ADurb.Bin325]
MLQTLSTLRKTTLVAVLFVALLIVTALAAGVRLGPSVALAAEPDAETTYRCTPAHVAAFTNGIHVKCTAAAPGGIWYFAYPTRDTANASRFLSLLTSAVVAGKQLDITYDPANTSGVSFGCLASDCRTIVGVLLLP